ncbi:MAG TPA: DoxX family protein [Thermoanaerobaculia bacterium]|nr:DoxX family protein [Thermoanaerobaculia bacterium]
MTATTTAPHHLAPERAAGAARRPLLALLRTDHDRVALVLRLALGLVILPHGAQKLLGWFGGHGFEGTMGYFTGVLGIPAAVAFLVILVESAGALALVTGFLGRVSAAGIAAVMAGAVLTSHLRHGFFMNWSGQQAGEGFEYHLLAIALAVALIVRGSGAWSLDRLLARRAAR